MKIPKDKTVAFTTGYHAAKILCEIEDKNLQNVIYTELYRVVSERYKQGYTHYYSGMSEGIDMLAANAVLDFKEEHPDVRFVAVTPSKWQQERYSTTGKNDYMTICSEADEIITLDEEESSGDDFYLQRNEYLVEHCSAMVCYHDGQCNVMTYTYTMPREQRCLLSTSMTSCAAILPMKAKRRKYSSRIAVSRASIIAKRGSCYLKLAMSH